MSRDSPLVRMRRPPHPGALLREDVLGERGLSVSEAAAILGVSHPNLSLLVNERIALSPEMARKLEAAFGVEADMLIGVQTDHNMARAPARQAGSLRTYGVLHPSVTEDSPRNESRSDFDDSRHHHRPDCRCATH